MQILPSEAPCSAYLSSVHGLCNPHNYVSAACTRAHRSNGEFILILSMFKQAPPAPQPDSRDEALAKALQEQLNREAQPAPSVWPGSRQSNTAQAPPPPQPGSPLFPIFMRQRPCSWHSCPIQSSIKSTVSLSQSSLSTPQSFEIIVLI
jgi:hypothetical protein